MKTREQIHDAIDKWWDADSVGNLIIYRAPKATHADCILEKVVMTREMSPTTRAAFEIFMDDLGVERGEVAEMLKGLDYGDDEIEYILTYDDYKRGLKEAEEEAELLLIEYINGAITYDAYKEAIEGLGFATKAVTKYLDKAKSKLRVEIKLPPKGDLIKWLTLKIISEDEFTLRMSNLKYNMEDILRYIKEVKAGT